MQIYFPANVDRNIHCPELSGGLSTVLQHPIQKQPFFFISITIPTLIARNNYILTRLQLCFCYHRNDSIILNYWRPLTMRLKQCQQKRIYMQGARQWEIRGILRCLFKMMQLRLENSSTAFYINLLFLIFFSPVVSDSLTLVLGDDCEESFTPGTDELLWWCKCGKYQTRRVRISRLFRASGILMWQPKNVWVLVVVKVIRRYFVLLLSRCPICLIN